MEVTELHREAMNLADQALVARLSGNTEGASVLLREAYRHEREAAERVSSQQELEPTRSVLHRSAASLALECNELRDAERLIGIALSGNPPDEIADELRDLLEQVYFHRHLATRGVVLQRDEFQMSLTGGSVGFGMTESNEFIRRVRDLETLIYRTAERKLGRPYREGGKRKASLQREVELYLSVPRAASFAVTFRLGSSGQLQLPGLDFATSIIDEVLDCFDLFGHAQYEELQRRIAQTSYYRNFVGLARQIAPDGEEIRLVGLTAKRDQQERRVVLDTPRQQLQVTVEESITLEESLNVQLSKAVQVRGILKLADSRDERQGLIEVIDSAGRSHSVKVLPGMMGDIVKPLYEEEVIVSGRLESGIIVLDSIDRAPREL